MKGGIRKVIVSLLIFLVVAGICGFAGYFIYTELFGENENPAIGGDTHDQNIYEINQYNSFNTFPTLGEPKILVIPVSFDDYKVNSTEANRKKIEKTFFVEDETKEESWKVSDTSWYSVAQYYYLSSGGNLKIRGKVSDWFDVGIDSKDLLNYRTTNKDYMGSGEDGTWWLLNQATAWYKEKYDDIDTFDTDGDNFYDLIWLVYNAPHYTKENEMYSTFWAFTYTNIENFDIASKANKQPYNYCWASFDFMYEGYGRLGLDAHTYIHETGHALGLNDYYSTRVAIGGKSDSYPLGGVDMMDFNIGDHHSFSKYKMGWTSPKEVISQPGEYKIKSTSDTGEFFIVSSKFAGHPFDEYFIIEYITPTGLNYMDYTRPYKGNNLQGYSKPGIRISHIDSRGIKLVSSGKEFIMVHETNYKNIDGVIINNSTRDDLYKLDNGEYCREIVIMQKNFTDINTSVLSHNFPIGQQTDNLLFYPGEIFNLQGKYAELMPSKSNLLDNDTEFNFNIKIVSLGEEAIISVY